MAVSFCLALAFFWWRQQSSASDLPLAATPSAAMQRAVAPAPPRLNEQASEVSPPAAAPMRATAAPEPLQPNYDGPPLPVLFAVTTEAASRAESNADNEPADTPSDVKIANISNSSDQPLDLTVIAVDIPTQKTSQASVLLIPGGRQTLGPDSGLRMASGNQITLRSRGFRDLIETVP
jgi:hypothetical protein